MYIPAHFRESDMHVMHQQIREIVLGVLVVADADGIEANHMPFHLQVDGPDSPGVLQCHVARSNPVWQRLLAGTRVLVVFQGPHAYVSPSWYPTKQETGRVVPTWNYLAVHATGWAEVKQDPLWLRRQIETLTQMHESPRIEPWQVSDAPPDYTEQLVKAIVGIEIRIESLQGKRKASQNHPLRNQLGVKAGLATGSGALDLATAGLIRVDQES